MELQYQNIKLKQQPVARCYEPDQFITPHHTAWLLIRKIIYSYYKQYGRKFPFRDNITPYNVLISEIVML